MYRYIHVLGVVLTNFSFNVDIGHTQPANGSSLFVLIFLHCENYYDVFPFIFALSASRFFWLSLFSRFSLFSPFNSHSQFAKLFCTHLLFSSSHHFSRLFLFHTIYFGSFFFTSIRYERANKNACFRSDKLH